MVIGLVVIVVILAPVVNPACKRGWCAYRDSWQDTDK